MSRIVIPLGDDTTEAQAALAARQVRALLDRGIPAADVQRFVNVMSALPTVRPDTTDLPPCEEEAR